MKLEKIRIYLRNILFLCFFISLLNVYSAFSTPQHNPVDKQTFTAEITYPLTAENITKTTQDYLEIRGNLKGIQSFKLLFKEINATDWRVVNPETFINSEFNDNPIGYLPTTRISQSGTYLIKLEAKTLDRKIIESIESFQVEPFKNDLYIEPLGDELLSTDVNAGIFSAERTPLVNDSIIAWLSENNDLYYYNRQSGITSQITTSQNQNVIAFSINSNHVIWSSSQDHRLHIYNIYDQTTTLHSPPNTISSDSIITINASENNVLFEVFFGNSYALYLLDLNTMNSNLLDNANPGGFYGFASSLSENNAFWFKSTGQTKEIVIYNLNTAATTTYNYMSNYLILSSDELNDNVVFEEALSKNIYLFNSITMTLTFVASDSTVQALNPLGPMINTDSIVWHNETSIFSYDMNSQIVDTLIDDQSNFTSFINPGISDDCLIWVKTEEQNPPIPNKLFSTCTTPKNTTDLPFFQLLTASSGPIVSMITLEPNGSNLRVRNFNSQEDIIIDDVSTGLPLRAHMQGTLTAFEKSDASDGNKNIFIWNILEQETQPLVTNSQDQLQPEIIAGKYLLYHEKNNNLSNFYTVYIVNIETGEQRRISQNGEHSFGGQYSESTNSFIWVVMPEFSNPNGQIKKCEADLENLSCASPPEVIAEGRLRWNIHWQNYDYPVEIDVSGDYLIYPVAKLTQTGQLEQQTMVVHNLTNHTETFLDINSGFLGNIHNAKISGDLVAGILDPFTSNNEWQFFVYDLRNNQYFPVNPDSIDGDIVEFSISENHLYIKSSGSSIYQFNLNSLQI